MRFRLGFPILLLLGLTILLGFVTPYRQLFRRPSLPEGLIQANGRMEGDRITVSTKFPGRIQSILAREGDFVRSGQKLAVLDDTQVRTRATQAEKAMEALQAKVAALRLDLELLRRDVPLAVEAARAEVARGEAVAAKAAATAAQARKESLRMERLAAQGAASSQRSEQTGLAHTVALNELLASRTAVDGARKRLAQAELGWDRIRVKEVELKEVEALLEQSAAALAEVRSVLADLEVRAPADGVVLTRIANLGEMVTQGAPLLDLVDLDRLYLKVYVPEIQIGKVRLGLPARIHTDSFPDRPLSGTVRTIASRAEFTPKEVQTLDERTKLVFAVKIYLDHNPDHSLTPGMPCDAVIRWKEDVSWTAPRW
ncbi:MAG: HlyD family efflux transporter periplasmic adaptor subunit [Syntrophobacteraceae bacterium]|jgi:HlyD family secretion protein|nr:HlyD family efflux transporter periplasmic adaptor subunit [Syntrophobacteraceae bacterium]